MYCKLIRDIKKPRSEEKFKKSKFKEKNMKKLTHLTALLIFILSVQISAQTETANTIEVTTKDGKVVILKSDGTWTYKLESNSNSNEKPNSDGLATVYFYRLKEGGVYNNAQNVSLNDKVIFAMPQNTFLGIKIKAGSYQLILRGKDHSKMTLQTEAGKTYFILLNVIPGGISNTYNFAETPREAAVFQMRPLSLLDESKLKDSNLVLVKEKPEIKDK